MKFFIQPSYSVQRNRRGGDMHEYDLAASNVFDYARQKRRIYRTTYNFMLVEIKLKTDQFWFLSQDTKIDHTYNGVAIYTQGALYLDILVYIYEGIENTKMNEVQYNINLHINFEIHILE